MIIGGGIIGASAAYFLAKKGLSVALIEKGRVAGEQSSRNWGWCRQQDRDEAEIPLIKESLRLWGDLSAEIGADTGFRRTGMLYVTQDPAELEVLGDGTQEKPYFHVADLIEAMLFIMDNAKDKLNFFNIGTSDTITTVRYLAETTVLVVAPEAKIRYTGGNRGWVGDVPKVDYSVEKLKKLGWSPRLTSNQAVDRAVAEIVAENS